MARALQLLHAAVYPNQMAAATALAQLSQVGTLQRGHWLRVWGSPH